MAVGGGFGGPKLKFGGHSPPQHPPRSDHATVTYLVSLHSLMLVLLQTWHPSKHTFARLVGSRGCYVCTAFLVSLHGPGLSLSTAVAAVLSWRLSK